MKAKEFTIVEKKRKNRKLRWAAYGPGPYGMYGVNTGYSGDGGVAEGKIKLYTDPNYFGAEVDDAGFDSLPIINIPLKNLIGFEPDKKMQEPKAKANVKKILAGLEAGDNIPPILIRKHENGYQVLDGHHRFWAYKVAKKDTIPARVVDPKDIEEIGKHGVAESFDQPYMIKWRKGYFDSVNAIATLEDGTDLYIRFRFDKISDQLYNRDQWEIDFYRGDRQDITGEGDAQRIFATVLKAIHEFVQKKEPDSIEFSTNKEVDPRGSRTRLYDRLVDRYARDLGYTLEKQQDSSYTTYRLNRKQGVAEATSSSYADEHGYVAEFVDKIGDMDYEFKITNIRTGNSGHYVIRPVEGQLSGRIQIDSMDVKDLQSGKAFHLSSGGLSRGGWDFDSSFFDAINALIYDDDQLEREIWQLFKRYDKLNDAAQDSGADGWRVPLMPGLSQRQPGTRSITATDLFRAQDAAQSVTQKAMQTVAGKKQATDSKKSGMDEATYPGNVGMMELIKFFTRYPEYKPTYLDIKRKNGAIAALKYALEKMETELSGEPFVKENFADGRVKGKSRPGRVKKSGASCKGSVTDLRARAKKYGGERGKMYHWCANMKGGKKK